MHNKDLKGNIQRQCEIVELSSECFDLNQEK